MSILIEISENIQRGKAKVIKELVPQALEQGIDAHQILNEGLMAGMAVIGEKFKNNEVFVPEVLIAARAMKTGTDLLKPILVKEGQQFIGRACVGTVKGDQHDIGKNLVRMMLESRGIEVIDLGVEVSPEMFVSTAKEKECNIICCSALLTTTMGVMGEVVQLLEAEGLRDKIKVMVGGAPVNQAYADSINADVYTSDAASCADAAVAICKAGA